MENSEAINLLRGFANLQKHLLEEALKDVSRDISEAIFRDDIPLSVELNSTKWETKVHGNGITFINTSTGEVINAHEGILSNPDAFDEWRLEEYAESKGLQRLDWNQILAELNQLNMICEVRDLARHYTVVDEFG